MTTKSQQPKDYGNHISTLNGFIDFINLAKEASSNAPAKVIFGSVAIILTMVRVSRLLSPCCIDRELEYA